MQAFGRAVEGDYICAQRCELHGFAAGSGAHVDDFLSFDIAKEFGGERGGGVLYPPCAVRESGEVCDVARIVFQAQAAGRELFGLKGFQPLGGLVLIFQGDVERGFGLVGGGDFGGGAQAVVFDPEFEKPGRGVEAGGVLFFQPVFAFAGQGAQQGVDEGFLFFHLVFAREANGCVEGGVVRDVHEEELGGAEAQDVLQALDFYRAGAVLRLFNQIVELAEAAKSGADEHAGEGAVSGVQCLKGCALVEHNVEGLVLFGDFGQDVEGGTAGG